MTSHAKRLILISDSLDPSIGGAEISTRDLIKGLHEHFETISLTFDSNNVLDEAICLPVSRFLTRIPRNYLSTLNPLAILAITKFLRKNCSPANDLIILCNISSYISYAIIPALRLLGYKCLHIIRDTYPTDAGKSYARSASNPIHQILQSSWIEFCRSRTKYNPLRLILAISCLKMANQLVTISKAMQAYLGNFGLETVIIYNGIDDSTPKQCIPKEDKLLGRLPPGSTLLLWPSRISEEKGLSFMLKLSELALLRGYQEIKFVFTCKYSDLRKSISKDISPNIIFVGKLAHSEVLQLMTRCHGVIYPSQYLEPFGRVPVEAMAYSSIPFVSEMGALPELVLHNETGLVLNTRSPEDSLQMIIDLFEQPQRMASIRQRAFEEYSTRFTQKRCVLEYVALVSEYLGVAD